jgi:predicted patatin/cPLA2 family phospholipase
MKPDTSYTHGGLMENHPGVLIERLHRKAAGDRSIRPLLLVLGGVMRGAYGAGGVIGLHRAGLGHAFDTVVGASTGAPTGSYFVAGEEQTKTRISIYYEECADRGRGYYPFISFRRFWNIFDVEWLSSVFREGKKAIDVVAIRKSRTKLFYHVMNYHRGNFDFIDAKTAQPDLFAALRASMSVPGISGQPIVVNHNAFLDALCDPFPLHGVIERFHPTDILVLPNITFARSHRLSVSDVALACASLRYMKTGFVRLAIGRARLFRESMEFAKRSEVNIGILWPPECGVRSLTNNPVVLKHAVEASERVTLDVCTRRQG